MKSHSINSGELLETSQKILQVGKEEKNSNFQKKLEKVVQSSLLLRVNSAFGLLRSLIPTEPADRKLSKIETLRLASSYIAHLASQLIAGPVDQPCLYLQGNFFNEENVPICTFCLSAHKRMKLSYEAEIIPSLEEDISERFFKPNTISVIQD